MSLVIKDHVTILRHSAYLAFFDALIEQTHGVEGEYHTESVTGKTRVHYTLTCETRELAEDTRKKLNEAKLLYGG